MQVETTPADQAVATDQTSVAKNDATETKACDGGSCMLRSAAAPTGGKRIASWILQIIPAVILLQTLFFKFTAAPEAVALFEKLGVEPWGRIGAGVMELITGVLLLWPRFSIVGAVLAIGIMLGAIASHFGPIGIVVNDDGGMLFIMAWIVLASAVGVLILRKNQVKALLSNPSGYLSGKI